MIYVLITTALIENNYEIRKQHYIKGINSILEKCQGKNYKFVIVEGNGKRPTFLDDFGVDVLYTENNIKMFNPNYGSMELRDILEFIDKYNVSDEDFIIKVTGRYYLDDPCPFFDQIDKNYDIVMKTEIGKCSSLIGMRCKYFKMVEMPTSSPWTHLEQNMGNVTNTCENICRLDILGIFTAGTYAPGGITNFILY